MNGDIDVWADHIDMPQQAGGTFPATCYTVWVHRDGRWQRVGATISDARKDELVRQVSVVVSK